MKLKRGLYLIHRWLGVGMCVLIAMWFVSGVVMMYVHFPALTPAEKFDGLPELNPSELRYAPDALLGASTPRSLTLTTVAGRPAWLAQSLGGTWRGLYADTGDAVAGLDESVATRAAAQFLASRGRDEVSIAGAEPIEMDQWTVSGGLNSHRPLFEVRIDDSLGTVLYVSSQTGQVVRDTTGSERAWNWLGANLHWIYPLALRRHSEVWYWVVVVLSSIGLVSIVSGVIIGIIRLRPKRPYRGRDWTPYRGFMKWHHVLGLVCSLFLFTFMLSGLLSMNPGKVFTSSVDYGALPQHYQGPAPRRMELHHLDELRQRLSDAPGVKEVRWQWRQGSNSAVLARTADDYSLLSFSGETPATGLEQQIVSSASGAMSAVNADASLLDVERLKEYDSYYYSHAGRLRPLPILRLRFADQDRSWLHIDARTGELLSHLTSHDRAERWWYHGLHSLDFNVLIGNRPLWDVVMIVLSILGCGMAVTSIVVGWRRLRPGGTKRTTSRKTRVYAGDVQRIRHATTGPEVN